MIVLAAVLALLVLLALIPIRVIAEYRSEFSLRLKVLFVVIRLLPRKAKPKKGQRQEEDTKKKSEKEPKKDPEKEPENKTEKPETRAVSATERLSGYLNLAVEFLGPLRKAVRRLVKAESLSARVSFGTGDAAQTAILVGLLWGAGYNLISLVDLIVKVEGQELSITPDYSGPTFEAEAACILRTNIANIICAAAILGIAYIRYILKTKLRRNKNE
ncbi:MAG: DUF2953 domain-containing protein [Oscillospiraceae bacterium]|nr:DUF2953 domain-containing protein [Oscillospiraceae bacterium]